MKQNKIRQLAVILSTALATAFVGGSVPVAKAQQVKKGAEFQMAAITTMRQAQAMKLGDSLAMVCAKCKSVIVNGVTTNSGHLKLMAVGEKHVCPGCKSTITVIGSGNGPNDEVNHVCEKCGEDSVFCCATKPGSGPTKGMEKKK